MMKNKLRRGNPRGPRGENPCSIREVWRWNFDYEITKLDHCLQSHTILSMDTEFPGCIRSTPWGAIDERTYEDFRFNLNQTKLIQMGITASDELGNVGGSWEFNFSDFDPQLDAQNPSSITFLKQSGLNFDKLKKDGIPMILFAANFLRLLRRNRIFRWVTFHGLYDIGYLLKAIGVVANELPESMEEFGKLVVRTVGTVRDLKHMARFCEGLEEGRLGLERLCELLDQKRIGEKHHAGSDSLMTACVHREMMKRFEIDSEMCDGYLYGISKKLQSMSMNMIMQQQQQHMYHHHHMKMFRFGQVSFPMLPNVYYAPAPAPAPAPYSLHYI